MVGSSQQYDHQLMYHATLCTHCTKWAFCSGDLQSCQDLQRCGVQLSTSCFTGVHTVWGNRQFFLLQLSHTCPVVMCRRSCQERSAYPGNEAEHHAAYPASKQASNITRAAVLALNCLPLSRWCWRTSPAQLSCT